MCCGGGSARPAPAQEPYVECPQGRIVFMPDARVVAQARGVDPCAVTPTGMGGRLANRQDVLRVINQG